VRFCASGALLRAAFGFTCDIATAKELRDGAFGRLLSHSVCAILAIEDLNDASIGLGTILQQFDEYLKP
jgi:hypothetical protein